MSEFESGSGVDNQVVPSPEGAGSVEGKKRTRLLQTGMAALALITASCGTIAGVGRDINALGKGLENAAEGKGLHSLPNTRSRAVPVDQNGKPTLGHMHDHPSDVALPSDAKAGEYFAFNYKENRWDKVSAQYDGTCPMYEYKGGAFDVDPRAVYKKEK